MQWIQSFSWAVGKSMMPTALYLAYNRRMGILEDQLLLGRILNTLFALVVLGRGFEIDRVTKISHKFSIAKRLVKIFVSLFSKSKR